MVVLRVNKSVLETRYKSVKEAPMAAHSGLFPNTVKVMSDAEVGAVNVRSHAWLVRRSASVWKDLSTVNPMDAGATKLHAKTIRSVLVEPVYPLTNPAWTHAKWIKSSVQATRVIKPAFGNPAAVLILAKCVHARRAWNVRGSKAVNLQLVLKWTVWSARPDVTGTQFKFVKPTLTVAQFGVRE